jgi:hypothetical protein
VDGDGGKWKWGADGKVEWSSIRARDAKFGNKKSEKKEKKISPLQQQADSNPVRSAGYVWPVPRRAAIATSAHLTLNLTCVDRIYTKAQRQTRQVKKMDLRRPAAMLVGRWMAFVIYKPKANITYHHNF